MSLTNIKDLDNIINDYVYQLDTHDKYKECMKELKNSINHIIGKASFVIGDEIGNTKYSRLEINNKIIHYHHVLSNVLDVTNITEGNGCEIYDRFSWDYIEEDKKVYRVVPYLY